MSLTHGDLHGNLLLFEETSLFTETIEEAPGDTGNSTITKAAKGLRREYPEFYIFHFCPLQRIST